MSPGDVGPHRAHVARRFSPFGDVSVWIDRPGRGLLRLAADDGSRSASYEQAPDGIEVAPTFSLDEDAARALLDALAAYFGGTGSVQTLRRDYDAERARVDRLIDKLLRDTT